MAWKCRLLEPIPRIRRSLRRFARRTGEESPCPLRLGFHNASELFDEIDFPLDRELPPIQTDGALDEWVAALDAWPVSCECGHLFLDIDHRCFELHRLYAARGIPPTTLRDAPVGAMWLAPWMARFPGEAPHLTVMLPGSIDWDIDGPSKSGGGWKRSGSPPEVTVTPSIVVPGYHGFVTAGYVTDDIEGRKYA